MQLYFSFTLIFWTNNFTHSYSGIQVLVICVLSFLQDLKDILIQPVYGDETGGQYLHFHSCFTIKNQKLVPIYARYPGKSGSWVAAATQYLALSRGVETQIFVDCLNSSVIYLKYVPRYLQGNLNRCLYSQNIPIWQKRYSVYTCLWTLNQD